MAKNKTGLEWLLEKQEPPPAKKPPPEPDPAIPIPPPEVKPEPWQVKQVAEIRADVPAKVLELEPKPGPIGVVEPAQDRGVQGGLPLQEGDGRRNADRARTERRSHPRAKVPMEVRYKKGSEAVVGKGVYLSLSGFFVESDKLLPPGEIFQAQLLFPGNGTKRLAVIAEAIWEGDKPETAPAGMGAKFLDVDDADLPFLKQVIEEALKTENKA